MSGASSTLSLTTFSWPACSRPAALDQRRDHATRPAPGRPEVDQHGHRRVDLLIEAVGGGVDDPGQQRVADAAARDPGRARAHAVLLAAVGTGDDRALRGHQVPSREGCAGSRGGEGALTIRSARRRSARSSESSLRATVRGATSSATAKEFGQREGDADHDDPHRMQHAADRGLIDHTGRDRSSAVAHKRRPIGSGERSRTAYVCGHDHATGAARSGRRLRRAAARGRERGRTARCSPGERRRDQRTSEQRPTQSSGARRPCGSATSAACRPRMRAPTTGWCGRRCSAVCMAVPARTCTGSRGSSGRARPPMNTSAGSRARARPGSTSSCSASAPMATPLRCSPARNRCSSASAWRSGSSAPGSRRSSRGCRSRSRRFP